MKMKTPEMSVVRFDAEDILTASDGPNWSSRSYVAWNWSFLQDDQGKKIVRTNNDSNNVPGGGTYKNYLDGTPTVSHYIFTAGKEYYYDVDSYVGEWDDDCGMYWNWKSVESGK